MQQRNMFVILLAVCRNARTEFKLATAEVTDTDLVADLSALIERCEAGLERLARTITASFN